jgi:hypothetical protein
MKNLLLLLLLIFSITSNSQIKEQKKIDTVIIGELIKNRKLDVKLEYTILPDQSRYYTIFYRNNYFQTLDDYKFISFEAKQDELDNLYNSILDLLVNGKVDESKIFKLGDYSVAFTKRRISAWRDHIEILVDSHNYFTLYEKELKLIFNK